MTKRASVDQAMFNVIDNLTDISQLTDYVFSNESNGVNDLGGSNNRGDSLGQNDVQNAASNAAEVDYPKLATPILEGDTSSNLSLLDHSLTDEEVYRYLSLFSDNNLQLVDELDLENTLQPCSSINSNATTVSTQETNEFRENLLNAEVTKGEEDCGERSSDVPDVSSCNYPTASSTATSTANQTDVDQMTVVQSLPDADQSNQIVYVESNTPEMASSMSDGNQMAGCQVANQMGQEMRVDYGQAPITYYSNSLMNGQMNGQMSGQVNQMSGQMSQFQYASPSMASTGMRMNFIGSETMANSNLVQTVGYRDMNGGTFLANGSPFPATGLPSGYPPGNEYFSECRDVNCPYTYCSRYNPYYNNFPFRNQFRPGYGDNFLPDASTNMNVIDNQIVFSKQSDQPFSSVLTPATGQTASRPKTKRTKHKQPKIEYTETSVICNESTDYTFFTLEENLRSKRKRGRKKKAATAAAESDAVPESTG